ncbi:MAG: hypothetical protein ABSE21_00045 [Bryobacteraceae bacterium]
MVPEYGKSHAFPNGGMLGECQVRDRGSPDRVWRTLRDAFARFDALQVLLKARNDFPNVVQQPGKPSNVATAEGTRNPLRKARYSHKVADKRISLALAIVRVSPETAPLRFKRRHVHRPEQDQYYYYQKAVVVYKTPAPHVRNPALLTWTTRPIRLASGPHEDLFASHVPSHPSPAWPAPTILPRAV